jgi:predicted HicB family RNase H-like nuclease
MVLHGRVIGINDVVDFYGRTIEELAAEFRISVDEYVEWCLNEGKEPEKTCSGKMTLRPSDQPKSGSCPGENPGIGIGTQP